jgi:hypothetical protein
MTTTQTNLEALAERMILDARPLMTVGQIRILLHVWDACEACEATGKISTRGYDSELVTEERCDICKGRGYTNIPEPESAVL